MRRLYELLKDFNIEGDITALMTCVSDFLIVSNKDFSYQEYENNSGLHVDFRLYDETGEIFWMLDDEIKFDDRAKYEVELNGEFFMVTKKMFDKLYAIINEEE